MSEKVASLERSTRKIELALWGENGLGGVVKDIHDIKSATSIFKSVVLPIIVAVVSSAITAFLLGKL